ncbi:hypothetical protein LTR78_010422 [Recurvomyces mirabilis]|uniref:Major facilitator superfamily (MFS) profile domain-containing protein n=1 Tax=Recurvomyces mirabilis TaxID=574656 RepID=A0AAE0WHZ3_9PEZI|nr:hypothetical protein LTR78_010422 [Recurvomyces mirabilis]KAK5150500.1 hypothetical protein LTS14_009993 [Recurvomyces mirabilis]
MTLDERQPLLHHETDNRATKPPSEPPPPPDPDNPQTWQHTYKLLLVLLLALMAFTVTFTCISLVPLSPSIIASLDTLSGTPSTTYASILLITIWELGEAAGPLLIAPLSEVYGRAPVFHAANALFVLSTAAAALSRSTGFLVLMRFITGVSVASNVLNPAVIGDLFKPEERGRAMSLVMLTPLMGGAIGPAVAGAVAQGMGWRAVLWMSVGLAVVVEGLFLVLFRETYLPAILRNRLQVERSEGKVDEGDYEDAGGLEELKVRPKSLIWQSIKRPATIFAGSFVLQIMSLYGAVMFSFFYIVSTTLPGILQDRYGFPPALVGSSFLSFSIGSLLGILVNNTLLDKIYLRLTPPNSPHSIPENRLPLTILGAFTLPLTIILYGFSASLHLPYPIVLLAVLLMGFTIMLGLVPMMSYIVDAFGVYSASALTAVLITRCLMSTVLPLAVAPLEQRWGYGWGMTVLAGLGLGLAPVPWVVMRCGGRWRQGCEFSKG